MDVCLFCVVCCQAEVSVTSWSHVQRSPTDCGASLCVITKPRELGGHSPRWAAEPEKIKKIIWIQYQYQEMHNDNYTYEGVSKIFWTGAVKFINLTTKCMWKLHTSTQLRATWHNDSLDMVVLPSIGALCYHNCCIDGGTSPEYLWIHHRSLVSDYYPTCFGHFMWPFQGSSNKNATATTRVWEFSHQWKQSHNQSINMNYKINFKIYGWNYAVEYKTFWWNVGTEGAVQ
jgi:hypothetical protein